jgi:hypothetical protein
MRRSVLLAAALVALLAAGCSKPTTPPAYAFSASGGKVSPGWAYDGTGLVDGGATLAGNLVDASNSGAVNVTFDYLGSHYVVDFSHFAQTKPFQDGGVRFNFDEHGNTGNGDASLPKVHAKAAAWGTATVTKDGLPLRGGANSDTWNAHLMLLGDSPRGPDGKIVKADGTTPYDINSPADAKVTVGKPQAMFYIQSPDGPLAMRSPVNDSKTLSFQGPTSTQTIDIAAEQGAASLTVNITFAGASPAPVGVGNASIQLLDAGGNVTKQASATITPQGAAPVSFQLTSKEITGAYKLAVTGTGAFSVTVDSLIEYDDHPFLVVTWNDYTLG